MWKKKATLEELNQLGTRGLASVLGIKITGLNDNSLSASMPVQHSTQQPFGLLHGGASAALAETLGSMGAWLMLEENQQAVGLELNINHIRSQRSGQVTACATPLHVGRLTQVWDIKIHNDHQQLVAVARLTVSVLGENSA